MNLLPGLRALALGCLVSAASFGCHPTVSQGIYQREAVDALTTYYDTNYAAEWSPVADSAYTEALPTNKFSTYSVSLKESETAAVLGSCDGDCQNLDISVVDPSGFGVDHDTPESARFPFVRFQAAEAGTYQVRVRMDECLAAKCFYAVYVLRRSGSASGAGS